MFSFFRILTFNHETELVDRSFKSSEFNLDFDTMYQAFLVMENFNYFTQGPQHLQQLCFFSDAATSVCFVKEEDTLLTIFSKRYLQGTEPVSTFYETADLPY